MTIQASPPVNGPTPFVGERDIPVVHAYGDRGSSMEIAVDTATLVDSARRLKSRSPDSRVVLLGVVLAELEGVSFEDTARLLHVKPVRLERMMHGTESIPRGNEDRWMALAEILRLLHSVLQKSATARWLNRRHTSLRGLTPLEAIEKGRARDVVAIVRKYRESAFS